MKFLTSLSPNRIERQQLCLKTWEQFGEITAVQTAGDVAILEPHFPGVNFVTTELTGAGLYGLPNRPRIKAIVDQGPGLLINSDIKITSTQQEFEKDWTPKAKQFNVGVRWDFEAPKGPKVINKCGVDAFLITEEVMQLLPDVGFLIGVPMWDYWIVWHMLTERFRIQSKISQGLLHLKHAINWTKEDMDRGKEIMHAEYGLDPQNYFLHLAIPIATGRKILTHKGPASLFKGAIASKGKK